MRKISKTTSEALAAQTKTEVFEHPNFGAVRTITEDGKTLFCGKDVAAALGYKDTTNAIKQHCKGVVKCHLLTGGGNQLTNFIPEGDVYRLATHSELPGADKFESWIFDEVLPSIRKHGGYIAGQEQMSDDELMARALLMAQSKIEERDRQIADMRTKAELDAPKVAFANAVCNDKDGITVEKFSKLLYEKTGLKIGRNTMFRILRDMGYLRENNMPYQRYMKAGYFVTQEVLKYGKPYVVTRITGKGQVEIAGLLVGRGS